jgi:hypothetical protein
MLGLIPRRHPEFFLATKINGNRELIREKIQDPVKPIRIRN